MKMKMSSARVAMAHDWKIAEAAWLHSAAKNGKRFGSEGSSLAFFQPHFSGVSATCCACASLCHCL